MTSSPGSFVERLVAELGADVVTPGADLGTRRVRDWSGTPSAEPIALIRPRTTQEVSRALAFCHANRQAVVTQGGLTGLAGGANLFGGEVALSLEYEIKHRSIFTPLIDLLFIRRAMTTSLSTTLARFGAELASAHSEHGG